MIAAAHAVHVLTWHDILHPLRGLGYQFWSGVGADLGEITLIGAFIAWWHHRNCAVKHCWRKGHPDPEHGHPICRKHLTKEIT